MHTGNRAADDFGVDVVAGPLDPGSGRGYERAKDLSLEFDQPRLALGFFIFFSRLAVGAGNDVVHHRFNHYLKFFR